MQPYRSAHLQSKTNCFKFLVNNAKRLVTSDSRSDQLSCDHDKDIKKVLQTSTQKFSATHHTRHLPALNQASRDLKRFLEEVGTDPKEARFWLKHFQELDMKTDKPFAVVEIHSDVFSNETMLERLASSLAFLYRNGMMTIIIHGISGSSYGVLDKKTKQQLIEDEIKLVDLLEKNNVGTRPFLCSSHMISVRTRANQPTDLGIDDIDVSNIHWCLSSGHIPIITAVGETEDDQVVYADTTSTTIKLASILKPTKIIFLNSTGGLKDSNGKVIDCVSIPDGVSSILEESKIDISSANRVKLITQLLPEMPQHTSAVITSADSLIKELFTHCGSGTLFQTAEHIQVYHSLKGVDMGKLQKLITTSFNQSLSEDYFSTLEENLHTLYVTESYTAAAVMVTPKETCGIPYLDKFSISKESQGVGTSQVLWEKIRENFPQLCWRSRGTNRINPWYFVRSTGSYQNGMWTVFWYGVEDHQITQKIMNYTCSLPSSFDPVAPHDENSDFHNILDHLLKTKLLSDPNFSSDSDSSESSVDFEDSEVNNMTSPAIVK